MADLGSFNNLLGENVFTQNNLLPRWERRHSYFINAYLIFFVVFELSNSVGSPHCLPMRDGLAAEMNEGEFAFVDSYCLRHDDDITQVIRFWMLLLAFLAAIIANKCLEAKDIENSVNAFSDAQRTIENLELSSEDLKRKAVSPILSEADFKSAEKKIREVIIKMISYKSGDPTNLLLRRGWTTVIILFITFLVSVFLWLLSTYQMITGSDYFTCTVDLQRGNQTNYNCTRPDTNFDFIVLILCGAAIFGHCEVSWRGVQKLRQIQVQVRERTSHGNNVDFSAAGRCMLFLARMNNDAGRKKSTFSDFVEFIFDENTLLVIERTIPDACGFHRCDTDEEFVYIYSCMADKQRLENFCAKYYEMILEGRRWKSVVILLNMMPDTSVRPFAIRNIISVPDDAGNNMLFYALDRKPCFKQFRTRAAQYILRESDPSHRIVWHENNQISARNFIQRQFDSDPTYPESLKQELDNLIRYIAENPRIGSFGC